MLAPRKVLWSTPDPAIDVAFQWIYDEYQQKQQQLQRQQQLQLQQHDSIPMSDGKGTKSSSVIIQDPSEPDLLSSSTSSSTCHKLSSSYFVICDVGCGDGRVLFRLAKQFSLIFQQQQQRQQYESPPKDNNNDDVEGTETTVTLDTNDNCSCCSIQRCIRNDPTAIVMPKIKLIGIDIDPKRIQEANEALSLFVDSSFQSDKNYNNDCNTHRKHQDDNDCYDNGKNEANDKNHNENHDIMHSNNNRNAVLSSQVCVEFHCMNALDCHCSNSHNNLLDTADVIFMYLIPRGLRQMKPIIDTIITKRRNRRSNNIQQYDETNDDEDDAERMERRFVDSNSLNFQDDSEYDGCSSNNNSNSSNEDNEEIRIPLLTVITYMSPLLPTATIPAIRIKRRMENRSSSTTTIVDTNGGASNDVVTTGGISDSSDCSGIITTIKQKVKHVPVLHQPGSSWPIYCYQFS